MVGINREWNYQRYMTSKRGTYIEEAFTVERFLQNKKKHMIERDWQGCIK